MTYKHIVWTVAFFVLAVLSAFIAFAVITSDDDKIDSPGWVFAGALIAFVLFLAAGLDFAGL